ncbi:YigZ family protein [Dubosiella newyorkensis]|uniref:YigZ family protein n=1 Tax=Dubosiella newyorkensis TaxID=1862672 RepID=UPI0026F39E4F|nr:YigZ family protein [Dubosiella newyorkensis]
MPKIMNDVEHEIEIKKSRFITYLHRSENEEEAKSFLKLVKKEHPNARHACTAMIIGSLERSNDDGEPAGTAGRPMLDVLQGMKMQDILAVTVRYFGGTLLGKGGLVKAYSSSVKLALNEAVLLETKKVEVFAIEFDYALLGKVDGYFRAKGIEIIDKDYQERVYYEYVGNKKIEADLLELSSGSIQPILLEEIEKETPISMEE